jgi:hypothetical protein
MRATVLTLVIAAAAQADVAVPAALELPLGQGAIAVEQNGKTLPIRGGVVRLKQAPFVLRFHLAVGEALLVHSWQAPGFWEKARAGANLDEVLQLEGNGMAEELFNKTKDVMLDEHAYSYWYYTDKNDHRFDRVKREGKRVIARRTIERLVNVSGHNVSSPIGNTAVSNLYFVFIRAVGSKELARATLQLAFDW